VGADKYGAGGVLFKWLRVRINHPALKSAHQFVRVKIYSLAVNMSNISFSIT
jgi:hypothetical protein